MLPPRGSSALDRYILTHFQSAIFFVRDPVERVVSAFLYTKRFSIWQGGDKIIFGPKCHNYTSMTQYFFKMLRKEQNWDK